MLLRAIWRNIPKEERDVVAAEMAAQRLCPVDPEHDLDDVREVVIAWSASELLRLRDVNKNLLDELERLAKSFGATDEQLEEMKKARMPK